MRYSNMNTPNQQENFAEIIERTIKNLERNGISAVYTEKKQDVIPLLARMISPGDVVAVGGSMTLFECGVIDFLRESDINFLDRYAEDITSSEISDIFIKSYSADIYITSSNAITENGELYNVDGRSNRVSAIAHGPKFVVFVVSVNKIVRNLDEAILRVKTIAAPMNCVRLNCNTYCKTKGECMSIRNENSGMTDGCDSDERICCNYLVTAKQRKKNRIKVIFIGENAGF